MSVEEQYMDVLQNIEFAVTARFRENPELTDYSVQRVYEALIGLYSDEITKRTPRQQNLSETEWLLFKEVKDFCEWRLGRENSIPYGSNIEDLQSTISLPEMITCLKRLVRSLQKWNRLHGRQGYLKYICQFQL